MASVNLKEQIARLEDLISFYIDKTKEEQKFQADFTQERLWIVSGVRNNVIALLGGIISALFGFGQLGLVNKSIVGISIIIISVIAFLTYFLMGRAHKARYFGLVDLLDAYDPGIEKLELVLEYSLRGSLDNADEMMIREIHKFVSVLYSANQLYLIKPNEQLADLKVLRDFPENPASKSKRIRDSAKSIHENYLKLDKNNIPEELQKIIESVFNENKEFMQIGANSK